MENNIFEVLTEHAINERLDEILLQDNEHQKLQEKIDNLIEQVKMLNLPREQWLIIDELVSAHTQCGCCYRRIAYQQGFKDCVSLLKEMKLSK